MPTPPLGQQRGRGGGKPASCPLGRPTKVRRIKEAVFDEDLRKEYLTGFSKRKKARHLAVRTKAIEREKEEKLDSRRQIRQERKAQAAQNVKNAKELYGDGGVSEDEHDTIDETTKAPKLRINGLTAISEDIGDEHGPLLERRSVLEEAYESSDLVTTVIVEPFSLSRSPSPIPSRQSLSPLSPPHLHSTSKNAGSGTASELFGPAKNKRRVKNKPAYRPKMTREDKKERAAGGKKLKKSFLKGNTGTKGRSNKT